MKLKKGDKIKIIAGKDKKREATIEKVYKKSNKILAIGVNIFKKHIKKSEKVPQGGVVELPRPIDISKIIFLCPKCGKTARLGIKIESGKRIRFCKKCKKTV